LAARFGRVGKGENAADHRGCEHRTTSKFSQEFTARRIGRGLLRNVAESLKHGSPPVM
jgi:hypothetical protein